MRPLAVHRNTFFYAMEGLEPRLLLSGESLSNPIAVGDLIGQQTLTGAVNAAQPNVYYRFATVLSGSATVLLTGLSSDADLRLLDANGNVISSSSKGGTSDDRIVRSVSAGTYYARVLRYSGDTAFRLLLTADYAGSSTTAARDLGALSASTTVRDYVDGDDVSDWYRFSASAGTAQLQLTGLSSDADLYLFASNGTSILAKSTKGGSSDELISISLSADTYYARVLQYNGSTNYTLTLTPPIAPPPPPPPPPTGLRFAIIGDFGTDTTSEANVASLVHSWNPAFVITTGDNNYPDGEASTIDAKVGKYYHDFIAPYVGTYGAGSSDGVNRFFPTLGNHDWNTGTVQPYLNYFTLPGNERYYNVTWGNVDFFVLDSDDHEPDGNSSTSIQAAWLQHALASSTAAFKLVFVHHPPYSSGQFAGSSTALQWPFQEWGATAVIAGHAHLYERLIENGFAYIVNGLGGDDLAAITTPTAGSQVRYNADYGALLVTADASNLTFQFVNRRGWTIDSFTLSTSAPNTNLPVAPGELWATGVSSTQINLAWNDLSNNESGFTVERSQNGIDFSPIATTGPNATTFTDLAGGSGFSYRIQAFNANGASRYTNISNVRPPGAGLPGPIDLGQQEGQRSVNSSVGDNQTSQYYRFTVPVAGTVSTLLTGLTADADLWLMSADGAVIGKSIAGGTKDEYISMTLAPGTYYVQPIQFAGNTSYQLTITSDYAGNTPAAARDLAAPAGSATYRDYINNSDPDDYYRFTVAAGTTSFRLSGLSADSDLKIYASDGITLLGKSTNGSTKDESLSLNLAAGTYYARVYQYTGSTNYNLSITPPALAALAAASTTPITRRAMPALASRQAGSQATTSLFQSSNLIDSAVGSTPERLIESL